MATSFRIPWESIPAPVRAGIEDVLGSAVVEAVNQAGGYSPSLAARCVLADGRRVFLKAGADASGMNAFVPVMLRREADLCRHWPDGFPAPRLLSAFDDGEWVVVAFEDVDGRPPVLPWRTDELDRVVATLDDLPTPPDLPLGRAEDRMANTFGGFATIAARSGAAVADEWTATHLERLVEVERPWRDAVRGDHVVHGDVRDDNLLLAADGRVLLVDWAHATIGAGWLDVCSWHRPSSSPADRGARTSSPAPAARGLPIPTRSRPSSPVSSATSPARWDCHHRRASPPSAPSRRRSGG